MKMSPAQRRALHWAGSGLALAAIWFVGARLHDYWLDLDLSKLTPMAWGIIAALSVAYGAANWLLAIAWWHLLRRLRVSIPRPLAVRVYGLSQLAKYVPGNIFQLAGRQALGMAQGMAAGALAKSMGWELGLLAMAGALFSWLIVPLLAPALPQAGAVFILLASVALSGVVLRAVAGRDAAWAFLLQTLFLVSSGAVFIVLLAMITGGNGLTAGDWLTIGGVYIAAWLVGLVTPGAPAGVGVREMVVLLLLEGMVGGSELLMAVLLGRLVTVVGDFLFFMAAYAIASPSCEIESK